MERLRAALAGKELWLRGSSLHVTGSAIVVDLRRQRVLLRWHERLARWMQVGGHADAGELDPFAVAFRESVEETGLSDLRVWPEQRAPLPLQIVIVKVPANASEDGHEHIDIRYLFATNEPERIAPESPATPLRWLSLSAARSEINEENLILFLRRIGEVIDVGGSNRG